LRKGDDSDVLPPFCIFLPNVIIIGLYDERGGL